MQLWAITRKWIRRLQQTSVDTGSVWHSIFTQNPVSKIERWRQDSLKTRFWARLPSSRLIRLMLNGVLWRVCFRSACKLLILERETGLEPATSSLGSWHSTTELLPHCFVSNNLQPN